MRSLQERYGDIFTVRLPEEEPWVMVCNPELVKQVFTAPEEILSAGEQKRVLRPILGPTSVMVTDGQQHMRARKLLLPAFHSARVARHEEAMRAVANEEIDRWPVGTAAPAAPRMTAIALRIILRTVFGLDENQRLGPLGVALERLMSFLATERSARTAFARTSGGPGISEFQRRLEHADELVLSLVAERRQGIGRDDDDDVLSLLLDARYEDGAPIGDSELRDQLITLLVAGHETVASSLSWAIERLVRSPEALARVVTEAADGGGSYTEATVFEALRVRPVVLAVPRVVNRAFRIGGYEIPPGVSVTPSISLVHLDPEVYPSPDEFLPERFLERTPGTYTWIPFGGGIRRCIGAGFSLAEMRVVLSTLLARAVPRAVHPEPEPPAIRPVVTSPAHGAMVVLER